MVANSAGGNAEQIEFWNGDAGARWASRQQRMDALLAPITDAVVGAARCAGNERVLDVGCGCGDTSLRLAGAGATVTGIDISQPMLARARQRARDEGRDVNFMLADAATATLANDHTLVFSRFGVMFFADPTAAFSNLRHALAPGGRLCFVCWQPPQANPWIMTPMLAARPFLPPQPSQDPHAPGPFAFADPDYVGTILAGAGFVDVAITPFAAPVVLGRDVDAALEMVSDIGPLSRSLAGVDAATRTAVVAAVRSTLETNQSPQGVALGATCWIVRAGT
jgi:SAM-dependent methyltransferase